MEKLIKTIKSGIGQFNLALYKIFKSTEVRLFVDPRTLKYRDAWKKSLRPGHSPLLDEMPMLTFPAIEWLESNLNKNMRVFEYGSGGSTIFFSRRVKEVVTVEHHRQWWEAVGERLNKCGINNCNLMLFEPERDVDGDGGFYSSNSLYAGYNFSQYVRAIDSFPEESYDLIVIDGRARVDCITHAIGKVKRGGFLILDNSERPRYKDGKRYLDNYPQTKCNGVGPYARSIWHTTIWMKDC